MPGKKFKKKIKKIAEKKEENILGKLIISGIYNYKKIENILDGGNKKPVASSYLRAKNIGRRFLYGKFNFVSFDDLIIWTRKWTRKLPKKYDIIVGIPRSGLTIANIISTNLGKPLTTPDLIDNIIWKKEFLEERKLYRILLIDDSMSTGNTMKKSIRKLKNSKRNVNIDSGVLIADDESKKKVDFYYKIVPHPRIFEWNFLHNKKGKVAVDMDGVLCEDPPKETSFDGKKYLKWIKNAEENLIPKFKIDVIISNRLEKYRKETEKWLKKHNVKYKKLILWNVSSKKKRMIGKFTRHKIKTLIETKPDIYWESNYKQAKEIWKSTKIPILCTDEMVLVGE